jgi:catechol 2,3-dioxygenase-like lactoylglutathione lyase family enzyme
VGVSGAGAPVAWSNRSLRAYSGASVTLQTVLQHVSLEIPGGLVRDCVRFWELLGFAEIAPPPRLGGRFTWVARNDTQIHLIPVDATTPSREGHVAVIAADYEASLAALRGAGFELRDGLDAWDAPRTFVRDPAGHLVEVMSKPPLPPWPA